MKWSAQMLRNGSSCAAQLWRGYSAWLTGSMEFPARALASYFPYTFMRTGTNIRKAVIAVLYTATAPV